MLNKYENTDFPLFSALMGQLVGDSEAEEYLEHINLFEEK